MKEITNILFKADIDKDALDTVIELLCSLTFLGVEVTSDGFAYSDDPHEYRRDNARARKYSNQTSSELSYMVHPAFRPFLEIR